MLATFLDLGLIVIPVLAANAMTVWITCFRFRGNEQARSGV